MDLVADTSTLASLCGRLRAEPYVTIDTEFLRDNTYWPKLCLVQLAGRRDVAAVDALAPGLDLAPLLDLLADEKVLKVFHAARQDIEIFYHLSGAVPRPVFDTQIAAMVCGFGESAAYETLVSRLARGRIDKSTRFTDWSLRPLTRRQIEYALADVTHLRVIYEKLRERLERSGRSAWLSEEMAILTDPATYRLDPEEAWRRLKFRGRSRRALAILREVAAWRERKAQERDVPRNRVLRDEAILEIAAHAPQTADDLVRTRGLPRGVATGRIGQEILEAVARALAAPESAHPRLPERPEIPRGLGPVVDLLRVLLKMRCEAEDVAQKLVATSADLERIAADDDADVPALKGWRRKLFGEDALALKHGRIAITVRGRALMTFPVHASGPQSGPPRSS